MLSPKDAVLSNFQLPRNEKAERAVLGAILFDPKNLIEIREILDPEDFFSEGNKKIYRAMVDFSEQKHGAILDEITLVDFLKERNEIELVGGVTYISSLTESIVNVGALGQYCEMIAESAKRRLIINTSLRLVDDALNEAENIEESVNSVEQKLSKLSQIKNSRSFDTTTKVVTDVLENIGLKMAGLAEQNLKTGIDKLDKMTNDGFEKQQFVVIGARPSVGKTSFVISMIKNMILSTKKDGSSPKVALFSLEMSANQIVERFLSAISKLPLAKIKSGSFTSERNDEHFMRLMNAAGQLSNKTNNLFIIDEPNMKLADIRSTARSLHRDHTLDAIVIDYIGLIESGLTTKNDARHEQVAHISRQLKALARELDIPIIALSQLSRDVDGASGKEISLSSIRDSGSIEQDADVVIFLQRIIGKDQKQLIHTSTSGDQLRMIMVLIAKQRNGETGRFALGFKAESASFENVELNPEDFN